MNANIYHIDPKIAAINDSNHPLALAWGAYFKKCVRRERYLEELSMKRARKDARSAKYIWRYAEESNE